MDSHAKGLSLQFVYDYLCLVSQVKEPILKAKTICYRTRGRSDTLVHPCLFILIRFLVRFNNSHY